MGELRNLYSNEAILARAQGGPLRGSVGVIPLPSVRYSLQQLFPIKYLKPLMMVDRQIFVSRGHQRE